MFAKISDFIRVGISCGDQETCDTLVWQKTKSHGSFAGVSTRQTKPLRKRHRGLRLSWLDNESF